MGDAGFNGVLVDVSQQSYKIGEVLTGFAFKAVLKEVACASVFLVEVLGIGYLTFGPSSSRSAMLKRAWTLHSLNRYFRVASWIGQLPQCLVDRGGGRDLT